MSEDRMTLSEMVDDGWDENTIHAYVMSPEYLSEMTDQEFTPLTIALPGRFSGADYSAFVAAKTLREKREAAIKELEDQAALDAKTAKAAWNETATLASIVTPYGKSSARRTEAGGIRLDGICKPNHTLRQWLGALLQAGTIMEEARRIALLVEMNTPKLEAYTPHGIGKDGKPWVGKASHRAMVDGMLVGDTEKQVAQFIDLVAYVDDTLTQVFSEPITATPAPVEMKLVTKG